jgi:hypothetical protein
VAKRCSTNLVQPVDTARPYSQVRCLNDTRNPLELLLALHRRRHKTSHNHREVAKNNHQLLPQLLCCSKPSRWRQPPKVTRIPQLKRSPSATRYKLTNKCTWNHSILLWIHNQAREISRREYAQLKRMLSISKCQESSPRAGQQLFICPQTNRAVRVTKGFVMT